MALLIIHYSKKNLDNSFQMKASQADAMNKGVRLKIWKTSLKDFYEDCVKVIREIQDFRFLPYPTQVELELCKPRKFF